MFLFCFSYVKIKFTFSYSYHSSNLGHVRKYTHKRFFCSFVCYFYLTILHQVATIFVVFSFFFVSCNLAGIFPLFPFVIFYFWGGRMFFFVKIVLKSLFLVSFFCVFFTLEGKKFICLLRSSLVLSLERNTIRAFCYHTFFFGKVGWKRDFLRYTLLDR